MKQFTIIWKRNGRFKADYKWILPMRMITRPVLTDNSVSHFLLQIKIFSFKMCAVTLYRQKVSCH